MPQPWRAPPSDGYPIRSTRQLAGDPIGASANDFGEFIDGGHESWVAEHLGELAEIGEEVLWIDRRHPLAALVVEIGQPAAGEKRWRMRGRMLLRGFLVEDVEYHRRKSVAIAVRANVLSRCAPRNEKMWVSCSPPVVGSRGGPV